MPEHISTPEINISSNKTEAVASVEDYIKQLDFTIVEQDTQRPWGAFFRIADNEIKTFIGEFFPGVSLEEARQGNKDAKLSPKLLLVSPGQRLSWQYHYRRSEMWRFLTPGAYVKSDTDEEKDVNHTQPGDTVQFKQGERHRLVGLPGEYTVVAEIWQHSDPENPSDEEDIVRLQDDYKRS